jgi:hypothetical protein
MGVYLIIIILSIASVIRLHINESNKLKRIKEFSKLPNSKIEAIGNYEKNARHKKYFKTTQNINITTQKDIKE